MPRDVKIAKDRFLFGWRSRLHCAREFQAVFTGKRYPVLRTSLFNVYRQDNHRGYPRVGIAVSKKLIRRAVDRNRIKRNIRTTFRQQQALPSIDFVVTYVWRGCTKGKDGRALPDEMRKQLLRIWLQFSLDAE